jgi:hypothetical protein
MPMHRLRLSRSDACERQQRSACFLCHAMLVVQKIPFGLAALARCQAGQLISRAYTQAACRSRSSAIPYAGRTIRCSRRGVCHLLEKPTHVYVPCALRSGKHPALVGKLHSFGYFRVPAIFAMGCVIRQCMVVRPSHDDAHLRRRRILGRRFDKSAPLRVRCQKRSCGAVRS